MKQKRGFSITKQGKGDYRLHRWYDAGTGKIYWPPAVYSRRDFSMNAGQAFARGEAQP